MKPCCYLLGLLLLLPWSVAAQNRVLDLDGDDSYVELPADLLKDVKNELTVEGWIRWQKLGNYSRFFDFGPVWKSLALSQNSTTANLVVYLHDVPRRVRVGISVPGVLRTNQWYHLAVTISGDGMNLYVDGVLAGSDRFIPLTSTSFGRARIGWERA